MTLNSINPLSLVLILMIAMVFFGTKWLRQIGNDLGIALRDFRRGLNHDDYSSDEKY